MWLIPLVIVGVVLVAIIAIYNGLVHKRNQVRNVFATIDVMLKKRWDLVPNLVATVKGYAQHEKTLFEDLTNARSRVAQAGLGSAERVTLENSITRGLSRLFAVVENYPQLKAGENFLHLQRTLNELEEQISAARRAYNAAVTDYNNAVQMFPSSMFASAFGFAPAVLFEIPDAEKSAPGVDLSSPASK